MEFPPFAYLCRWMEDNTCQSIWDYGEVLLVMCWWTQQELGEHMKNLLGTHWELGGDIMITNWDQRGKLKFPPPPPSPNPKENNWGPLTTCCTFSLAACNSYLKIVYHLILASTNSPFQEHGCIIFMGLEGYKGWTKKYLIWCEVEI